MRPTGRRGFALVAVLWVLVLASAVAAEVHGGVRADQRAAANARAEARARWAARGALARLEDALRRRVDAPSALGALVVTDTLVLAPLAYSVDGIAVRAAAVDVRARLSLDHAEVDALARLFAALGAPRAEARRAAAAVDAYRRRVLPDVSGDDAAAWTPWTPPVFASADALREVPGVPPALAIRAMPYVAAGGDGRVNVNTAAVPVLATLPGIDTEGARALVARRARAPFLTAFEVADALPGAARRAFEREMPAFEARAAYAPREVELRAEARIAGSPVGAEIRAVAVLDGGRRAPVAVVVER